MKGPLARPDVPLAGLFVQRRFRIRLDVISLHPISGCKQRAFSRPGSDLLSRVLRRSTISAGAFHGRVRNGIGCSRSAITTRSAKRTFVREAGIFVPWHMARAGQKPSPEVMDISNENDQANRAISTGKLHALPHFHTRPINVVVFHGSQGILVLRWVSRLDAFSGYPVRI